MYMYTHAHVLIVTYHMYCTYMYMYLININSSVQPSLLPPSSSLGVQMRENMHNSLPVNNT